MNSIRINNDYFKLRFSDTKSVVIDRSNTKLLNNEPSFNSTFDLFFENVIGVYKIDMYTFCAVSTKSEPVCDKLNIRKVTEYEVLQITKGETNNNYLSIVKKGLGICNLYFSTDRELSCTLLQQAQYKTPREKFIWNWEAKQNALEYDLEVYIQNFIAGNVETYSEKDYSFILISRRSTQMAGTRYWTRGADSNGYTANFVETEQIIIKGDEKYSFVQIRGSIPLSWTQYPNLMPQPLVVLDDNVLSNKCCEKHFEMLKNHYGKVVVVCLTETQGPRQGKLTRKYLKAIKNYENVRTVHFPVISKCKGKDKFNALYQLVDEVGNDIQFTHISGTSVVQTQDNVIRSNCLDCLDRTNLAQSYLAQAVMKKLGLEINLQFKTAWFDNGNSLSIQYAGTPARNGDVTTTGKRTLNGQVKDTISSTKRYFIGTFRDGNKQDEYEAVTKHQLPAPVKATNCFIEFFVLLFLAISLLFTKGLTASRGALRNAAGCFVQKPHFKQIKYPDPNK